MYETLTKSAFFVGLTSSELAELFQKTPHSVRSFTKGQTIMQRDEEVNYLWILIEGIVKGEMVDFSGKILKVEEIHAPHPLAHAVIFSHANRLPVDVVALTDCKILYIPKADVLRMLQSNAVILNNFLMAVSNRAHFLTTRLWLLSFKTIKEKVAHYLLSLSKNEGRTTLIFSKSHQELAELFGVTRPSLTRVFGEMQDEGIIFVKRREVTILNRNKMLEMIK